MVSPLNSVLLPLYQGFRHLTVQQMKCSIFARELLGGLRTALLIMLLDRYVVHTGLFGKLSVQLLLGIGNYTLT